MFLNYVYNYINSCLIKNDLKSNNVNNVCFLGNILIVECGFVYFRNIYRKIENDLCCLINNEWRGK